MRISANVQNLWTLTNIQVIPLKQIMKGTRHKQRGGLWWISHLPTFTFGLNFNF